MDLQSPWHATALLGTAMETAGFPSRLNSGSIGSGLQATLSDLVSGLNLRGRQTMSRLQMSIVGPTSELEENARTLQASEGDKEMENPKLDTDLFDILRAKPLTGRRNKDDGGGTPHLFGQAITTRGTPQGSNDGDQGRQRSRAALVESSTQR